MGRTVSDADETKAYPVHFEPAECSIDLGDGSERGEYVSQDYILQRLGKPLHAINLMYCYYPKDETWPLRASVAYADRDVSFAWDYPYDDYFPYMGGLHGDTKGEPFLSIRDVRRHGQDVVLTLTMDPTLSDDEIAAVARDLIPYGRLQIRINHEATGSWFSFNKRASYPEVAEFFARCVRIFHREAPQIKVILCLDGYKDEGSLKMEKEDDFIPAILAADVVSVDRYLALHWGWPYDMADSDTKSYARYDAEGIYRLAGKSAKRYDELCGIHKPMVLSELNADGDVTGPYDQAEMMKDFAGRIKADDDKWLDGFTFYQFRDRGRLGLETEDPNNKDVGIPCPVMDTFIEMINDPYFSTSIERGLSEETKEKNTMQDAEKSGVADDVAGGEPLKTPVILRWGGSDDADGLAMPLSFDGAPVFIEAYFEDELKDTNLMLELNGRWFYKAPGVTCIDLMPAFFGAGRTKVTPEGRFELPLHIFAPPADGANARLTGDEVPGLKLSEDDWLTNSYTVLPALPRIRIRTKPIREAAWAPEPEGEE